MTEEKAGSGAGPAAGTAAGAGKTGLWIAGAAAGLAAGAVVWAIALRAPPAPQKDPAAVPAASAPAPAEKPAPEAAAAPAPATPTPATSATSAPATAEAPASATAEAKPAEPAPAAAATGTALSAPTAAPAATGQAAAPAAPNPAAPVFDTVRAEAGGSVLIAGRAAPGAEVAVLADGKEVARVTADDKGQFVAFADLVPNGAARVLTLQSGALPSDQSVILAPVEAPVAVASATPGPSPSAEGSSAAAPAPAPEPAVVPAPAPQAAPEVLIADAEGVRKMAPAPTEGVVIDTISYAANGDVMLAGRGQGLVRLYLDDGLVAEARPEAGGWQARLTDVAPGLYRLRADEIAADGKVTSRFETPFQREAPETLIAAATPAAPAPGAGALPMPVLPSAPPAAPAAAPAAATASQGIALPELPQGPAPVVTDASVVTVQPGFTLWRIARENYGDGALYVKVFQANKDLIRNPDLIYPGQVFTVPDR